MFDRRLDSEQVFEQYDPMHRTYVRRRLILGVGVLSMLLALAMPAVAAAGGGESSNQPEGRHHVVAPGETLWDIAVSAAPGEDPRPLIAQIEAANDLSPGAIVPGQVLVIPAAR